MKNLTKVQFEAVEALLQNCDFPPKKVVLKDWNGVKSTAKLTHSVTLPSGHEFEMRCEMYVFFDKKGLTKVLWKELNEVTVKFKAKKFSTNKSQLLELNERLCKFEY